MRNEQGNFNHGYRTEGRKNKNLKTPCYSVVNFLDWFVWFVVKILGNTGKAMRNEQRTMGKKEGLILYVENRF